MKVKLLIEELKKCDPEAFVKLHHPDPGFGDPALFLLRDKKGNIWIEGQSDVDLGYQLSCRLDDARKINEAEYSVYGDIIDHGLSPQQILNYLDDEDKDDYLSKGLRILCENALKEEK